MKRLLFTATLLGLSMLAGGFSMGDDKKGDANEPIIVKASLPRNYSKLGLNDKQKKNIYRIRANYAVKVEELNRQLQALKEQEKAELEKVLTEAQRARLMELQPGGAAKEKPATQEKASSEKAKATEIKK